MLPAIWRHKGSLAGPTFDDLFDSFFYGWPSQNSEVKGYWNPRVDVHENEKSVYLDIDLPGIDKKDIKVEVKDHTLTISGERKEEHKSEDSRCYRSERSYGKFERSFNLSDTVESDKVAAEYKNGVLTLTVPKTEKAMPKEIQVAVK
jgi:HSP20 family protein